MVSKPLHVKRFKKALVDYQQSISDVEVDHTLNSYSSLPPRHLSTGEILPDRHYLSSLIQLTPINNSSKTVNPSSPNWCLNVSL
jgi:hypothetical protein